MHSLVVYAPDETASLALAAHLAERLPGGARIGLSGALGAGKTTFARAIARRLGVRVAVTSPTFVLVREYDTPGEGGGGVDGLLHLDLYRLSPAEVPELLAGCEEALAAGAVALIEWPERAAPEMPIDDLRVRLQLAPPAGCEVDLHWPGTPAGLDHAEGASAVGEPRWIELRARTDRMARLLRVLAPLDDQELADV